MKRAINKILLIVALIVTMLNINVYAVSMNAEKTNDKALNISLSTEERNSKSSFSQFSNIERRNIYIF